MEGTSKWIGGGLVALLGVIALFGAARGVDSPAYHYGGLVIFAGCIAVIIGLIKVGFDDAEWELRIDPRRDGNDMATEKKPYSFERIDAGGLNGSVRSRAAASADYATLKARLGLPADDPRNHPVLTEEMRTTLNDFVVHHHLNIIWYERAIRKEVRLRRLYFYGSLALLLAIPALIYWLSQGSGMGFAGDDGWEPKISVLLTGFFAFYRGLSAWMDRRKIVALYASTRSQLKEAVYTLEQKWSKKIDAAHAAEFATDAALATQNARKAVASEHDQHFAVEAAPAPILDLGELLSTTKKTAADLTTGLAAKDSKESTASENFRKADQEVKTADATVRHYSVILQEYQSRLANATDTTVTTGLQTNIETVTKELHAAQLKLELARIELNSLKP